MGHVLSKFVKGSAIPEKLFTEFPHRSPGQILEKPCVRSRGHIFSRILMKVDQDVCLDDILDKFKNGSCGVKN